MKSLLLIAAMACSIPVFAQENDDEDYGNLKTYKASNGVTYNVGDSVKLGYGSSSNGYFQFVQLAGLAAFGKYNANSNMQGQLDATREFANLSLKIIKIKHAPAAFGRKIYFVVKSSLKYAVYIEDAIATCEVTPCKQKTNATTGISDADELAKFKKLMDDGVITPDEFAAKKKAILEK